MNIGRRVPEDVVIDELDAVALFVSGTSIISSSMRLSVIVLLRSCSGKRIWKESLTSHLKCLSDSSAIYLASVNEANKARPRCSERASRCIDGKERMLLARSLVTTREREKEENEQTDRQTIASRQERKRGSNDHREDICIAMKRCSLSKVSIILFAQERLDNERYEITGKRKELILPALNQSKNRHVCSARQVPRTSSGQY